MFLDLPIDLQENIFQRLDAKDRVKMKLALPKKNKIYKADREIKLAITSSFIKKNRSRLLQKQSTLKPCIIEFLKSNINDITVKQYCDEFGITKDIDPKEDDLANAIQNNNVCIEKEYVISKDYFYNIYKSKPDTFTKLYINKSTQKYFIEFLHNDYQMFVFNLFNYENKELLQFVLNGDYEFKSDLKPYLDRAIEMIGTKMIGIFIKRKSTLQLIMSHLSISKETIVQLMEKAEEDFHVESWVFLMNHLANYI